MIIKTVLFNEEPKALAVYAEWCGKAVMVNVLSRFGLTMHMPEQEALEFAELIERAVQDAYKQKEREKDNDKSNNSNNINTDNDNPTTCAGA